MGSIRRPTVTGKRPTRVDVARNDSSNSNSRLSRPSISRRSPATGRSASSRSVVRYPSPRNPAANAERTCNSICSGSTTRDFDSARIQLHANDPGRARSRRSSSHSWCSFSDSPVPITSRLINGSNRCLEITCSRPSTSATIGRFIRRSAIRNWLTHRVNEFHSSRPIRRGSLDRVAVAPESRYQQSTPSASVAIGTSAAVPGSATTPSTVGGRGGAAMAHNPADRNRSIKPRSR